MYTHNLITRAQKILCSVSGGGLGSGEQMDIHEDKELG